ncbi:MAG: hypothetical protein WA964_08305, partial [Ilumatobacter sp.]|uniref:hypothetical protein n=1 Tax=Ilumatobacter sp. TaxID=1967498 RepID=UPI003C74AEBF
MSDTTVDTPSAHEATEAEVTSVPSRASTRRSMMFASAGAAAAAAVALTRSDSVAADDDDPLILGQENTSQSTTRVVGQSLEVTDGISAGGSLLRNVGNVTTGVYGFTGQESAGTVSTRAVWGVDDTVGGVGVFGQHGTTGEGVGVVAQSFNGPGLGARGTTFDVLLQ